MPEISIIIPAYKARNYLAGALASVAGQTFRDWEIIIVDDCSPEPADDIVDDFQQSHLVEVRRLRHEKNQGLGATRNTGIHAAKGEWIALLDHDDLWAPDHLASLREARQRHGGDVAYCSVRQFHDQIGDSPGVWGPRPQDLGSDFPIALFDRSFITPSATLIRRSLLLDAGGFNTDPRVHMCEDLDLWMRLLKRNVRFSHADKPTCYYRKHSGAATSRKGYMSYQAAWVRQIHRSSAAGPLLTKHRIVAARWWRAWLDFLDCRDPRWDVLLRALASSFLAPAEIGRGLCRTFRILGRNRGSVMY